MVDWWVKPLLWFWQLSLKVYVSDSNDFNDDKCEKTGM